MSYNDLISRANASPLIPEQVFPEVLQSSIEESAVMRLARKLPNMSRNQERLMVSSALATAYFRDGDTGLAQTSNAAWINRYIYAEELDVIIPIPNTVLNDAAYDIWGNCKQQIAEAVGVAVDQAVLYGTNIPANWSTALGTAATAYAGLVARCTVASHTISQAAYTDWYEALLGETVAGADGLLMLIEADGFVPTGHIAHTSVRGKLRNTRDSDGQPIFHPGQQIGMSFATGSLDGSPILYPMNGSVVAASSLVISGQWNQLVYAIREDLKFRLSDQAVIQGPDGSIIYNLFQQNMVALIATIRLGFALPNPINRINGTELTRCPFAVLTA